MNYFNPCNISLRKINMSQELYLIPKLRILSNFEHGSKLYADNILDLTADQSSTTLDLSWLKTIQSPQIILAETNVPIHIQNPIITSQQRQALGFYVIGCNSMSSASIHSFYARGKLGVPTGLTMMQDIILKAQKDNLNDITVASSMYAHDWYKQIGFNDIKNSYLLKLSSFNFNEALTSINTRLNAPKPSKMHGLIHD